MISNDREEVAVLLDLGLARGVGRTELTGTGMLVGTDPAERPGSARALQRMLSTTR